MSRWKCDVFCDHPRWEATWNDGIVECWNNGYEKRENIYFIKNAKYTFYNDARQTSIFCFRTRKYANIKKKSILLYSF